MGSTKSKWRAGQLAFYDGTTHETVKPLAPTILYDDFLGTTLNTDFWASLHSGGGSIAHATSNLTLNLVGAAATEEEGISAKNDKAWNADKGFIFECRATLTTAPTLTAEMMIGVQNDSWGAGSNRILNADEVSIYAAFGFYATVGAGLVACIRTKEAVHASGIVSTGVTSTLGTYQVFRIDFTNVADVKFYIDGVGVCTTTTFNMSDGANVMFQPIVAAQKNGAGADVGVMVVDYVRIWQATR